MFLGWAGGGCSCPCHIVKESGQLADVLVVVGFRVKGGRKQNGWVKCSWVAGVLEWLVVSVLVLVGFLVLKGGTKQNGWVKCSWVGGWVVGVLVLVGFHVKGRRKQNVWVKCSWVSVLEWWVVGVGFHAKGGRKRRTDGYSCPCQCLRQGRKQL